MGLIDVDAILRFWPVLLIAFGAFRIVESRDDFAQSAGIFWVVVGGFFLLGTLGILRVALHQLWPVFLIGVGALMLWRSKLSRRERANLAEKSVADSAAGAAGFTATEPPADTASTNNTSPLFSATAILGGVERRINSQDFRGGEAAAILGGCHIDLRSASIVAPNTPVIKVFALFGGIEIRVPDDWTVVSEVEAILGGYDDKKTWPPKIETKRLIIRGSVIMGGIEVKN
jgi:predicted membrane protein